MQKMFGVVAVLAVLMVMDGVGRAMELRPAAGTDGVAPMSVEDPDGMADPMSLFIAGRRYMVAAANTGNRETARRGLLYLRAAARAGLPSAARYAGSLLLTGEAVPRDVPEAVRWFRVAADMGDADSQRVLGDLYRQGVDVPRDMARAVYWYERMVTNHKAHAEPAELWEVVFTLAGLYARGEGVPENGERARELWRWAATEGAYPPAAVAYARALEEGIGGAPDRRAAVQAYYDAARNYRKGAIQYSLDPARARRVEREIIAALERIEPGSRRVRDLREQLEVPASGS